MPMPRQPRRGQGEALLASVERLGVLAADRGEVLGVGAAPHARRELGQPLLQRRGLGIAVERREALGQRAGVALLRLCERDLAAELAPLALQRLELSGELDELARLAAEPPAGCGGQSGGQDQCCYYCARHCPLLLR